MITIIPLKHLNQPSISGFVVEIFWYEIVDHESMTILCPGDGVCDQNSSPLYMYYTHCSENNVVACRTDKSCTISCVQWYHWCPRSGTEALGNRHRESRLRELQRKIILTVKNVWSYLLSSLKFHQLTCNSLMFVSTTEAWNLNVRFPWKQ